MCVWSILFIDTPCWYVFIICCCLLKYESFSVIFRRWKCKFDVNYNKAFVILVAVWVRVYLLGNWELIERKCQWKCDNLAWTAVIITANSEHKKNCHTTNSVQSIKLSAEWHFISYIWLCQSYRMLSSSFLRTNSFAFVFLFLSFWLFPSPSSPSVQVRITSTIEKLLTKSCLVMFNLSTSNKEKPNKMKSFLMKMFIIPLEFISSMCFVDVRASSVACRLRSHGKIERTRIRSSLKWNGMNISIHLHHCAFNAH